LRSFPGPSPTSYIIVEGLPGFPGAARYRKPDHPECPLWVKSRRSHRNRPHPLYTRKRTFGVAVGMSAKSGHCSDKQKARINA
jgi:hypothetical protein